MKILLTGTHFTPAVAVISELKKNKNIDIIYVGRRATMEGDNAQSIESQVVPLLGVEFIPIVAGRWQRTFNIFTFYTLFKIPIGLFQALYILLIQKPDVILSFGGYVSIPLVFWGWLLSIPIITHQQTLTAGIANIINNIFASKIAISFKQNNFNDKRYILSGNPLREQIIHPHSNLTSEFKNLINVARKNKLPIILITGGNQGSHVINQAVEGCIDKLLKIACVIHVSGDNKFRDFERLEKFRGEGYIVKKWIGEQWASLLSKTDLVISRAGINTLMELAYFQKPALVIPIPYLYQDEQNENAKFFENLGLTRILPQSKLSSKVLLENIKQMVKDLDNLRIKAKGAKKVVVVDAAQRVALETILLLRDV